jgi:uncharacterized protein (DUF433 family)
MSERRPQGRPVRETASFRLSNETLERLDARARALRVSRTTVVERLLDEALRLVEHPGIVFRDGPAGRRPGIVGSGLDVWEAIVVIRANGGSVDEAAAYLDLPVAGLRVAARYYAAFPDEIDAWIAANQAAFDRERHLAAEERRLLT